MSNSSSVIVAWPALGLCALPLFAMTGNLLVTVSVFKERCLHYVTNYFVVNMAIADLMVAFFVMPFAIYSIMDEWRIGYLPCSVYCCLDVVSTTASIYSMVAISADRWYSVTYHEQYVVKVSKKRYKVTCCAVLALIWMVAWSVGLPVLQGNAVEVNEFGCIFSDDSFVIYSSVISYFGPALVMLGFHISTVYVRKRQLQLLFQEHSLLHNPHADPLQYKRDSMALQPASASGSPRSVLAATPDEYKFDRQARKSFDQQLYGSFNSPDDKAPGESVKLEVVQKCHERNGDRPINDCEHMQTDLTVATDETKKRFSVGSFGQGNAYALRARRLKYWWFKHGKHFYHGEVITKKERRDRNTTKTLSVVVAAFLLCWLPFFALHLAHALCKHCIPDVPLLLATWLGYISSGINPLIYTIFNPDFRRAFHHTGKRIICYTKVKAEDPKRSTSFFDRLEHD